MKKAIHIILLLFLRLNAMAQDSLAFKNRFLQTTYIGVPLFAAGVAIKGEKDHFRALRNDFVPNYHNEIDNYIQYLPAALPIALKACGVESQSSWGKMMTAEATSFALVTAFAQGIKRTAHEQRPDGSNRHSFPSGHTASAFMAATILSKEYGHYSPWVSIGAYSMATTTGVMRMLNNRHWMSDVLSGAGIGLVSAELGYWISDMLFPAEPKSHHPEKMRINDPDRRPSFFATFAGLNLPLSRLDNGAGQQLETSTGATFGFEGAWYLSRHFGIGARTAFSDVSYVPAEGSMNPTSPAAENTTHFSTFQAGAYANLPICQRLFAEGKILAGTVNYAKQTDENMALKKRTAPMTTAGLSIGVRANDHFDVKATLDYSLMAPRLSNSSPVRTVILSSSACIRF